MGNKLTLVLGEILVLRVVVGLPHPMIVQALIVVYLGVIQVFVIFTCQKLLLHKIGELVHLVLHLYG